MARSTRPHTRVVIARGTSYTGARVSGTRATPTVTINGVQYAGYSSAASAGSAAGEAAAPEEAARYDRAVELQKLRDQGLKPRDIYNLQTQAERLNSARVTDKSQAGKVVVSKQVQTSRGVYRVSQNVPLSESFQQNRNLRQDRDTSSLKRDLGLSQNATVQQVNDSINKLNTANQENYLRRLREVDTNQLQSKREARQAGGRFYNQLTPAEKKSLEKESNIFSQGNKVYQIKTDATGKRYAENITGIIISPVKREPSGARMGILPKPTTLQKLNTYLSGDYKGNKQTDPLGSIRASSQVFGGLANAGEFVLNIPNTLRKGSAVIAEYTQSGKLNQDIIYVSKNPYMASNTVLSVAGYYAPQIVISTIKEARANPIRFATESIALSSLFSFGRKISRPSGISQQTQAIGITRRAFYQDVTRPSSKGQISKVLTIGDDAIPRGRQAEFAQYEYRGVPYQELPSKLRNLVGKEYYERKATFGNIKAGAAPRGLARPLIIDLPSSKFKLTPYGQSPIEAIFGIKVKSTLPQGRRIALRNIVSSRPAIEQTGQTLTQAERAIALSESRAAGGIFPKLTSKQVQLSSRYLYRKGELVKRPKALDTFFSPIEIPTPQRGISSSSQLPFSLNQRIQSKMRPQIINANQLTARFQSPISGLNPPLGAAERKLLRKTISRSGEYPERTPNLLIGFQGRPVVTTSKNSLIRSIQGQARPQIINLEKIRARYQSPITGLNPPLSSAERKILRSTAIRSGIYPERTPNLLIGFQPRSIVKSSSRLTLTNLVQRQAQQQARLNPIAQLRARYDSPSSSLNLPLSSSERKLLRKSVAKSGIYPERTPSLQLLQPRSTGRNIAAAPQPPNLLQLQARYQYYPRQQLQPLTSAERKLLRKNARQYPPILETMYGLKAEPASLKTLFPSERTKLSLLDTKLFIQSNVERTRSKTLGAVAKLESGAKISARDKRLALRYYKNLPTKRSPPSSYQANLIRNIQKYKPIPKTTPAPTEQILVPPSQIPNPSTRYRPAPYTSSIQYINGEVYSTRQSGLGRISVSLEQPTSKTKTLSREKLSGMIAFRLGTRSELAQSLKARNKISVIQSTQVKQAQRISQIQSQTQSQRQSLIQVQLLKQNQVQIQSQQQRQQQRQIQVQREIRLNPGFTLIPVLPRFPPKDPPLIPFKFKRRRDDFAFGRLKAFKIKVGYLPSLTSSLFDIRSSKQPGRLSYASGLNIRPITI